MTERRAGPQGTRVSACTALGTAPLRPAFTSKGVTSITPGSQGAADRRFRQEDGPPPPRRGQESLRERGLLPARRQLGPDGSATTLARSKERPPTPPALRHGNGPAGGATSGDRLRAPPALPPPPADLCELGGRSLALAREVSPPWRPSHVLWALRRGTGQPPGRPALPPALTPASPVLCPQEQCPAPTNAPLEPRPQLSPLPPEAPAAHRARRGPGGLPRARRRNQTAEHLALSSSCSQEPLRLSCHCPQPEAALLGNWPWMGIPEHQLTSGRSPESVPRETEPLSIVELTPANYGHWVNEDPPGHTRVL